jgi:hypothetical protein
MDLDKCRHCNTSAASSKPLNLTPARRKFDRTMPVFPETRHTLKNSPLRLMANVAPVMLNSSGCQ